MKNRKIALALGGGAARGFAHIGVLKVLEEAGLAFDLIAGTSIGAIIGALYCSGMKLPVIELLAGNLRKNAWMDVTIPPRMGLVTGDRLEKALHFLTRGAHFADLRLPLVVTATDLRHGRRVTINSGPVARAVRASAAIPGIFHPVALEDGAILVDGGVLEKIPVPAARACGADIVIAVDVGGDPSRLPPANGFDVIALAIDLMSSELVKSCLADADFIITPPMGDIAASHFHRAAEAVQRGAAAARHSLPALLRFLQGKGPKEESRGSMISKGE